MHHLALALLPQIRSPGGLLSHSYARVKPAIGMNWVGTAACGSQIPASLSESKRSPAGYLLGHSDPPG